MKAEGVSTNGNNNGIFSSPTSPWAKTTIRVAGYVVAAFVGIAILWTLSYTIPLVQLVPSQTASAAEIFAISFVNRHNLILVLSLTAGVATLPTLGWYCWSKESSV